MKSVFEFVLLFIILACSGIEVRADDPREWVWESVAGHERYTTKVGDVTCIVEYGNINDSERTVLKGYDPHHTFTAYKGAYHVQSIDIVIDGERGYDVVGSHRIGEFTAGMLETPTYPVFQQQCLPVISTLPSSEVQQQIRVVDF